MVRTIGMVECSSIARGIYVADQMVKISEVEIVNATSVCPGKYISIVHGDVSAVEAAVQKGVEEAGEFFVDSMLIPHVHRGILTGIVGADMPEYVGALGILESFSLSAMMMAADAVLKAAELEAIEIRLGTGLGGKSFFTFTGDVAAVKIGVETGMAMLEEKGWLLNAEVIAAPSEKLVDSLY